MLTSGGQPYGVCTGSDDTVWYTLLDADRIGHITADGRAEEFSLSLGCMPSMIWAGPDGALWVTLNQANAICRCSIAGDITTYPLPTPGAAPVGICASQDAVWIALEAGTLAHLTCG